MNKTIPKTDSNSDCAPKKNSMSSKEEACESLKRRLDEQMEKSLVTDLDSLEKRILGRDFS